MIHCCCCCQVASVVSDPVWPHRRQPTRLPDSLVLVYSLCCITIATVCFQNIFTTLKIIPVPLAVVPHCPFPSPWQPLIYFLSVYLPILWTSHINRITQDVDFCIWFLLLSIVFSKFIHAAACISISLLFMVA